MMFFQIDFNFDHIKLALPFLDMPLCRSEENMIRSLLVLLAVSLTPATAALAQNVAMDTPPMVWSTPCCELWGEGKDGVTRPFCYYDEDEKRAYECALQALIAAGYTHIPEMDECENPCTKKYCLDCPEPENVSAPRRSLASPVVPYKVELACRAANGTTFCIEGRGDSYCEALQDARSVACRYADVLGLGELCSCRVCKVITAECQTDPCRPARKVLRCRLFR